MLIRRADAMEGRAVEMEGARGVTMRLMVGRQDGAPSFSMRHFTVAPGGHTPRHSHNYEHEVYVVEGRGRVEQDGELRELKAGDVVYVRPNALHQFTNDSEAPFAFLCMVPTSFDCGAGAPRPTPGS
jgi:quercetin dioxygenase-like cupin family protein